MKFTGLVMIAVMATFIIQGCGGADAPKDASSKAVEAEKEAVELDPMAQMMARGEKIYKEKCIICHQANGEGILHAFPPLKDSDYLFADKIRAVEQVLNGSHEDMIVNGILYNAPMPPQVDNHYDAVAVTNYVLNSWGNEGGYVALDDVKHIEIGPRW
jgi:mono/diheme cytochrome c family protein